MLRPGTNTVLARQGNGHVFIGGIILYPRRQPRERCWASGRQEDSHLKQIALAVASRRSAGQGPRRKPNEAS